jgi:RNA polymerase sigma-70 factor (ECF subfamily)
MPEVPDSALEIRKNSVATILEFMVDLPSLTGVSRGRTLHRIFLADKLVRFADMASAPISRPACPQLLAAVERFASNHYAESGAGRFGIDVVGLAALLTEVISQRDPAAPPADVQNVLTSLRLEELVLARACMAGHETAWEIFLTRYRGAMFEAAYKIAHDEVTARALADSLYADLYGVNQRGEPRTSKLHYYLGRGSLAGWLRTVVAQEYVNQYRRGKRETSLETAIEDGRQFAAAEAEQTAANPRIAAATASELAALNAQDRFLLAAYYLDRRTLAQIAQLLRVHESTISRKLDRAATGLRKRIRKRLILAGMTSQQADEAMQDVDVRDLPIQVTETLRQGTQETPFYKEKAGEQG